MTKTTKTTLAGLDVIVQMTNTKNTKLNKIQTQLKKFLISWGGLQKLKKGEGKVDEADHMVLTKFIDANFGLKTRVYITMTGKVKITLS